MASNTLTGLIPTIVKAADVVSRELVGMIPAVTLSASADQVGEGQTITYPIAPAGTNAAIAPAATGPDPAAETISTGTMAITKVMGSSFFITAEEEKGLSPEAFEAIMQARFAQRFRSLSNEMEADLTALYPYASRAYGAANTAPFGTAGNLTDLAQVRKILVDNGQSNDLQVVLGTTAGANLRAFQSQYQMAGDVSMQRQGILQNYFGMSVRESGQIKLHTAGTAANATTNAAGYAVGDTTITVADAGTGTILTGDILVSARDLNKYVALTGDGNVATGSGTFVINAPGLRQARTTATDALTLTATYTANLAFARSAIHLVCRVPAMPSGGDSADDVINVTDAHSGITFQIAVYRQRRRVTYEVGLAWGVKAVKSEGIAILIS